MTKIPKTGYPSRLRALREQRGLTLEQVAKGVGRTKSQVSKWELGDTQLNVECLKRLSLVLDISPADILNEADGSLSETERWIINTYRKMHPAAQAALRAVVSSQKSYSGQIHFDLD